MIVLIMYKCGMSTSLRIQNGLTGFGWHRFILGDSRFNGQLFFPPKPLFLSKKKKEMTSSNSRTAFVKI